jgi:hypothetical protein
MLFITLCLIHYFSIHKRDLFGELSCFLCIHIAAYGSKGVDTWNLKSWQKEISDNDVCLSFPENYFRLLLFITDFTFMIWSIDRFLGLMDFLTLELTVNLFLNL